MSATDPDQHLAAANDYLSLAPPLAATDTKIVTGNVQRRSIGSVTSMHFLSPPTIAFVTLHPPSAVTHTVDAQLRTHAQPATDAVMLMMRCCFG